MEKYLPPISGKRKTKSLFEHEKKESEKLKRCQKTTRVDEQEPLVCQYNQQAEPEQCKPEVQRKRIYRNLETGYLYLKILMPCNR